jgi:hypothetical protein
MENEKITIISEEEKKALLGTKTVIIEEVEVDGEKTERKRIKREIELDTDVLVSIISIITMGVLGIALLVYLFFL